MLFLGALWTGKKLSSVEPGPISVSLSQKEKLHSSTPRKNKPKCNASFALILCGIVFFIAAIFSASSAESAFEETLIISIIAGVLLGIGIEKLVSNREKSSSAKMKSISRKDEICDEFLNKDFALFEDDNDIEKFNLIEGKKEPSINLERYAVMCNAYLEHQDELAQYEETQSESS